MIVPALGIEKAKLDKVPDGLVRSMLEPKTVSPGAEEPKPINAGIPAKPAAIVVSDIGIPDDKGMILVLPLAPVAPVATVTPVGPVAPVIPVGPVGPISPVAPVLPVAPSKPVGPVGPVAPVSPVAPVAPVTPIGLQQQSSLLQLPLEL